MVTQKGLECPLCHDRIFSNSRHDFVSCKCSEIFIDGGFDYMRWGTNHDGTKPIPISRKVTITSPYFRKEKSK